MLYCILFTAVSCYSILCIVHKFVPYSFLLGTCLNKNLYLTVNFFIMFKQLLRWILQKKEKVTGWWRQLHDEEFCDICPSPNAITMMESRRMWWRGYIAYIGKKIIKYSALNRKTEGKRSLGRSRCRWEDNIKMDLKEVGWEGVAWIFLGQDRGQWWFLWI